MKTKINTLKEEAKKNRKKILEMVYRANAGHPGGSLSVIDILTAIYANEIDFNSAERSRVVLSKGHATPALYAVLNELGFIEDSEFNTFRKVNSRLQGHPDKNKIPEIDANTGLLGQGLSIGVGMALGKKLKKDQNKVYVILGDGELHEGQVWEALMSAPHYKLDNLVAILDYNRLSSKDDVNKVMNLEPINDKIKAFNWELMEINGHSMEEITDAIEKAKGVKGKPVFIIADTVKGKGVSFMENNPKWHSGGLSDEEYKTGIEEIEAGGNNNE
ncbi:transketolase [Sebaldella sp. S0638]|uniref:transketolase n=1 Tax=Sebaldella sp. S0638 TaxID=2957809 RepID=UPI00209F3A59|nr:transketolase [Sebaldella sp. S0638]MCP1223571.1 transketolase [Sebaldella sp. S0638]